MNIAEEIKKLRQAYETAPTIEKLATLREAMVVAQDANNASEGFRNLLTQLYPDNAHYISNCYKMHGMQTRMIRIRRLQNPHPSSGLFYQKNR